MAFADVCVCRIYRFPHTSRYLALQAKRGGKGSGSGGLLRRISDAAAEEEEILLLLLLSIPKSSLCWMEGGLDGLMIQSGAT
jgi:hypothetical protein